LAKVAKDAAAGAVLIFSIFALITGIAVFGKYIIALF
jgi:diacylglycerol kinase